VDGAGRVGGEEWARMSSLIKAQRDLQTVLDHLTPLIPGGVTLSQADIFWSRSRYTIRDAAPDSNRYRILADGTIDMVAPANPELHGPAHPRHRRAV
jgi:hypothetical protein